MKGKRLVVVIWEDSCGCASTWTEIREEANPDILVCWSVGWLLHDGPDCVVVLPHWAPATRGATEQGCGDMTIPRRAILSIVDLGELSPGT